MTNKSQDIIFGIHSIIELLKAKRRKIYMIYTTKPTPKSWEKVAKLLNKNTQIQYVARDIITRIAGTTDHQGVVAYADQLPIRKKFFNPEQHPLLIMLDSIQDPRNLGAILRSTYCTNFDGVIICQKSSAPLNGTVVKSSAGLSEYIEIYEASSPQAAMQELKKAGYNIYFAMIEGQNVTQVTFQQPLCLVIGNEATGVNKNLLSYGSAITLPQKSSSISYNASVAAGILLFMISNQFSKI